MLQLLLREYLHKRPLDVNGLLAFLPLLSLIAFLYIIVISNMYQLLITTTFDAREGKPGLFQFTVVVFSQNTLGTVVFQDFSYGFARFSACILQEAAFIIELLDSLFKLGILLEIGEFREFNSYSSQLFKAFLG